MRPPIDLDAQNFGEPASQIKMYGGKRNLSPALSAIARRPPDRPQKPTDDNARKRLTLTFRPSAFRLASMARFPSSQAFKVIL
jgi:hypothetical protein